MSSLSWAILGLAVAGLFFLVWRAGRIWQDASRLGFDRMRRFSWALLGTVVPSRYWWGARIEALSSQEQAALLADETAALGLSSADSLRCPLCNAEVAHAWALTAEGRPTSGPRPAECPRCDFRLDCCRHCAHFLLGRFQMSSLSSFGGGDITFGRCERYKTSQPVEQACPPEVAHQLEARGYRQINAPMPIVDSFVPPDFCTAFTPDRRRVKDGGIYWPNARRVALLRMLAPSPPVPSEVALAEESPAGDDQWLL
jgi:hypothetical protein